MKTTIKTQKIKGENFFNEQREYYYYKINEYLYYSQLFFYFRKMHSKWDNIKIKIIFWNNQDLDWERHSLSIQNFGHLRIRHSTSLSTYILFYTSLSVQFVPSSVPYDDDDDAITMTSRLLLLLVLVVLE